MMPMRRTAVGRLAALILGAVAMWRLRLASTAFFAPVPPPEERDGPTREAFHSTQTKLDAKLRKVQASKGANHHLKVLLGRASLTPFSGGLLDKLETETETTILVSGIGEYYPFSASPLKTLLISGNSKTSVLRALEQIIGDKEKTIITFLLPRSVRGRLIGEGGDKIRAVREKTNAIIFVKSAGFESTVEVNAPSPESALAVADYILDEEADFVDEMRDCLTTNYLGGNFRSIKTECVVYLPMTDAQVAQMIGKGGERINRVKTEFFVNIQQSKDERDKDGNFIVKISGTAGDVHACHLFLLNRFASQPGDAPRKQA